MPSIYYRKLVCEKRGPKAKPVDDDLKNKVLELHKLGVIQKQISKQSGISLYIIKNKILNQVAPPPVPNPN